MKVITQKFISLDASSIDKDDLSKAIFSFISNVRLHSYPVLFARHGESQDNVIGTIGGDSAVLETIANSL